MGADPAEVALTGSTTDGVNAVLASLELGEGHEVLTSDEEHPGVWAPLMAARERRGVAIRVVPFADLASEVRPETSLVACSHVSWISGRVVDTAALSATGVPVLLDGAQALGAVPVDVAALGVDFYAASGQKWLCGPNGTGYLFVTRERTAGMPPPWPGYSTLESTLTPFEAVFRDDARRFDLGFPGEHQLEWALASIDVLMEAGLDAVHATSRERAAWLAGRLTDAGRTVGPRGDSTLVSWEDPDPEVAVGELLRSGFVLRNLPGTSYVRASVGAWNSEEELERLARAVTG
jgi:L-cysteine/cystine lyase